MGIANLIISTVKVTPDMDLKSIPVAKDGQEVVKKRTGKGDSIEAYILCHKPTSIAQYQKLGIPESTVLQNAWDHQKVLVRPIAVGRKVDRTPANIKALDDASREKLESMSAEELIALIKSQA